MQFLESGPDIPEELILAQMKGELLFIVGSGVSKRLGLPLFGELVGKVYAQLGQVAPGQPNCLGDIAETDAWERSEWDRVLGLLEKRIVYANPNVPEVRNSVRASVADLLLAGGRNLEPYKHILNLSKDAYGRARIVTTNFDTLIERAWHRSLTVPCKSYVGPGLPAIGSPDFHGVLHLHGRIADKYLRLDQSEMVLTSADFGEAYLRAGWASRFVYDLLRRYTLVFIGYAADDPPMRYMLEATEAGRLKFPDLKRAFAFADITDNEGNTRARWRAKGLEPVVFANADRSFNCLYATLAEWSACCSTPAEWSSNEIKKIVSAPYEESTDKARSKVRFLASTMSNIETLSKHAKHPDWFDCILTSTAARPSPIRDATTWLSGRLEDRNTIKWVLERAGSNHAVSLAEAADLLLNAPNRDGLAVDFDLFWRLFREIYGYPGRYRGPNWAVMIKALKRGQLDNFLCRDITEIVSPRPQMRERWRFMEKIRGEQGASLSLGSLYGVEFSSEQWPPYREILNAIPKDGAVGPLIATLNSALAEMCVLSEAAHPSSEGMFASSRVNLIHEATKSEMAPALKDPLIKHGTPNHADDHNHDFVPIVRVLSGLWLRLHHTNKRAAISVASGWLNSDCLLIRRLGYWAASGERALVAEAENNILALTKATFWERERVAESARFWCLQWNALRLSVRRKLERLILAGPTLNPNWSRYTRRTRREIVDDFAHSELRRITTNGGKLSRTSVAHLRRIERKNATLKKKEGLYEGLYSVSWSGSGPSGDPKTVGAVQPKQLVKKVDAVVAAHPHDQQDLWSTVCHERPLDAIEALRLESLKGQWPAAKWRGLLNELYLPQSRDLLSTARKVGLTKLLQRMPAPDLTKAIDPVANWASVAAANANPRLRATVLLLWDRIAAVIEPGAGEMDDTRFGRDLAMKAINDPSGRLVDILLTLQNSSDKHAKMGLAPDLRPRFDKAMSLPQPARLYALAVLLRGIAFFNWLDPDWTETNLFAALDQDTSDAAQLLEMMSMYGNYQVDAILTRLKPRIFNAIASKEMSEEASNRLATFVMWATIRRLANKSKVDLSPAEVRSLLTKAPTQALRSVAWSLWRSIADAPQKTKRDHWRKYIKPFLSKVWPNDVSTRDSSISDMLVKIPSASGTAFPEVANTISDLIVPSRQHSVLFGLGLEDGQLIKRHPKKTLELALAATDLTAPPAYDLADFLGRIAAAQPKLRSEAGFQKLNSTLQAT